MPKTNQEKAPIEKKKKIKVVKHEELDSESEEEQLVKKQGSKNSKSMPKNIPKKTEKTSTSPWIAHIKKTQDKLGCTYKEAMVEAKKTYKKK